MKQTITSSPNVSTSRKVTKAKLTKNDFLDVEYEEIVTIVEIVDGEEQEKSIAGAIKREGKNIVHDDMKIAFNLLRSHLAILCDQVEAQDKTMYDLDDDEAALEKYKVNSYSIGGSGEHEGVTLTGSRKGRGGAPINLNSPFTKFEGGEHEDTYDHSYELRGLIGHINEEALKYLDGKIAPNVQTSMDFDAHKDNSGEDFD